MIGSGSFAVRLLVFALLVVAGCSSAPAFSGVLLDGTEFTIRGLSSEETANPSPSGLLVVDRPAIGARVIGEHVFIYERDPGPTRITADNRLIVPAGDWTIEITVYDDVLEKEFAALPAPIDSLIVGSSSNGFPVVKTGYPFRLALDEEVPDFLEVRLRSVSVRKGCDREQAIACSDDGMVQVVMNNPRADRDQFAGITIEH